MLRRLKNKVCWSYLDDEVITARDWTELLHRLSLVFAAFRNAKLTLNIKNVSLEKLFKIVSKDGLKPGAEKIYAIKNFPEQRNVHEVHRFLGLSGFFRRFISKYAIIA